LGKETSQNNEEISTVAKFNDQKTAKYKKEIGLINKFFKTQRIEYNGYMCNFIYQFIVLTSKK